MRWSFKDLSTNNSSGSLSLLVTRLTRIMKVLRCVFPCLFLIIHMVVCKEYSVKWLRHTTTDVTYGTSTPVKGALSTSQCMASCSATAGCESFNVHRANLQCELSTHHPAEGGLPVNQRPGWTVYYKGLWKFIYWGTIHYFSFTSVYSYSEFIKTFIKSCRMKTSGFS
jgi:hypothetical protein